MQRKEFLEKLQTQLEGRMQEGRVAAHMRYYEDYIQSRVRGGENEASVIETLGDPLLIARTLIDTDPAETVYEDGSDHYHSYADEFGQQEEQPGSRRTHILDFSTWYGKAIGIVLGIVILMILFRLLIVAIPFFLLLAVVLFVISKIKGT